MGINIPQYNSTVSLNIPRPTLPDPSTASMLYRQGAQGAQHAANSAISALHQVSAREHQEDVYNRALEAKRRTASINYNADEARLSFDQDMQTFLRDGSQQFADDPEGFYKTAANLIRDRATYHSQTKVTPNGEQPRFENDKEAAGAVRGDLLQRGGDYLKKANEITTQLTVARGLKSLSQSEDERLSFARNADSVDDVMRATQDMSASYARSAGTLISADEAVKSSTKFGDNAWMEFHDAQAQKNPDQFLIQVSKFKPDIHPESVKTYRDNNYRGLTANIGKVSETTLTNALNLGNIDVSQYKDLLKSKGLGADYIADRTYSGFLSEIDRGNVPIHTLADKESEWASAGLGREQVNGLRSAVQNHYDRMVSYAERMQKQGEQAAKQKSEELEAKVLDMLDQGQIKSVDQVKPLLNASVESSGMLASRKKTIEDMVRASIGVSGPGDPHTKNVWELDIRSGSKLHTSDEIRLNKQMNLDQKNNLLKVLKDEQSGGGMRPEDKAVYDEYKKKVALIYGEKGIAASYTIGEAQVLATALTRYSELVRAHKMHPADAAEKIRQEMTVTQSGRFYGGSIPDAQKVLDLATKRASRQPTGVSDDTLDFWIAQYKQKALVDSVFPKANPMQGVQEGRKQ